MYKDKKKSASKIKSVSDMPPPSQEDCLIFSAPLTQRDKWQLMNSHAFYQLSDLIKPIHNLETRPLTSS